MSVKTPHHPGSKGRNTKTAASLLDTLEALMIERQVANIPIKDIAERSGINQGLITYYFGNKANMELALLRRAMRPAMEQLEHLDDLPLPPQEKLRIHVSGVINTYFRHPYVNRLMHRMMSENPAVYGPIIIDDFSRPVAEAQKKILDEGLSKGIFRDIDPVAFYFHLIGACDQIFHGRYQLLHLFGRSDVDDELRRRYIDHLCSVVTLGISASP